MKKHIILCMIIASASLCQANILRSALKDDDECISYARALKEDLDSFIHTLEQNKRAASKDVHPGKKNPTQEIEKMRDAMTPDARAILADMSDTMKKLLHFYLLRSTGQLFTLRKKMAANDPTLDVPRLLATIEANFTQFSYLLNRCLNAMKGDASAASEMFRSDLFRTQAGVCVEDEEGQEECIEQEIVEEEANE